MVLIEAFVFALICIATGWLLRWWYLKFRPSREERSSKVCGICHRGLGPKAIRTHDGHWRCAEHKRS